MKNQPIGKIREGEYARTPVYNPQASPTEIPHVILIEEITSAQLDAHRQGVLVSFNESIPVLVKKITRNNEARFMICE